MPSMQARDLDPNSAVITASASLDVLSELLENARLRGWVAEETNFTAPWRIRSGCGSAGFYFVLQGHCRFEIEGRRAVVDLAPGDMILTTHGQGHSVCSSPPDQGTPGEQVVTVDEVGRRRRSVSGKERQLTKLVYGGLLFNNTTIGLLISSLPPFIHVTAVKGRPIPWLADTIGLILRESEPTRPGRQAIVNRLVQMIFIQAVRSYATTLPGDCHNWLAAIMDRDIGPALGLMHSQPERPWTVALLADSVGMSRSAFASRFKNLLSKPPQQYLLECRMRKACTLLVEGEYGVKQIAGRVGYATDAAFANAFKRWSGKAPGTYRRAALNELDPKQPVPRRSVTR